MKHCLLHKLTVGMLILCLSFCTHVSFAEEKQKSNAWSLDFSTTSMEYAHIKSLCWVGDTLYMLGNEGVYQWHVEDEKPQMFCALEGIDAYAYMQTPPEEEKERKVWAQAVQYLVTDGTQLFAYHPYSGQIFHVQPHELVALQTLPADLLTYQEEDMQVSRELKTIEMVGGNLYLLLGTSDMEEGNETSLVKVDMKEMQAEVILTEPILDFCTYGAEHLMCLKQEGTQNSYQLVPFSLAEKTWAKPFLSRMTDLTGNITAWKEEMLLCTAGQIIACDKANNQVVKGYVPADSYKMEMDCSLEGLCAVADSSYVFIRDLTQPVEKTVLYVMGKVSNNTLIDFALQNPDIEVVLWPQLYGDDLQEAIMLGATEVDVFVAETPGPFEQLKTKGYVSALEKSASLKTKASAFYPSIQDAISMNGQLMAMPIQIATESWTLNETSWGKFDLGELPKTYVELLNLVGEWQETYAEDNMNHVLVHLPERTPVCVEMIVREYILQCGREYPDFTKEDFKAVMQALIVHQDAVIAGAQNMDGAPLIYTYFQGFGINYNDDDRTRMMLMPAISAEKGQNLSATLSVLAINSNSKKQEAALRFVDFVTSNLSDEVSYMLNPHLNTPLRGDNYEEICARYQEEKAEWEAELLKAEEADKKAIQEKITEMEKEIIRHDADNWKISAESIQNYREVAEHLVVPYYSPFLGRSSSLASLSDVIEVACGRKLTEQNLDKLLQDLTRIVRMTIDEEQ